jgi:hypothetical protein
MLEICMNPLTLGLAAAAITLFIMRGRRRGRANQLFLPADAGFTNDWSAQPSTSSASSSTSTQSARNQGTLTTMGRDVQAALRQYCTVFNAEMQNEPDMTWCNSAALNDGIIGPATERAWAEVTEQIMFVSQRAAVKVFGRSADVTFLPLRQYANNPESLARAISTIRACANRDFFARLDFLTTS